MKIVLLPGLDGTGELFEPFVNSLPGNLKIQIISYKRHSKQSYKELVDFVITQLPNEEFILIAESFSGPIAYQVALSKPCFLKSLILVATFLENPRPVLLYLFNLLPISRILRMPIPTLLIKIFFLGNTAKKDTIDMFKNTIKSVSPSVISFRLQEISKLQNKYQSSDIKVIYIQATNDKLIPNGCLKGVQKVFKNISVQRIIGPHFILQANPKMCAEVIIREVYGT